MMLQISERRGLTCFRVRVQPGAHSNQIVGLRDGVLKVRVAAPARELRANRALLELLASALRLPRNRLALLGGNRSREKTVGVRGVSEGDLQRALGLEAGH